jgi:hypothetical protein
VKLAGAETLQIAILAWWPPDSSVDELRVIKSNCGTRLSRLTVGNDLFGLSHYSDGACTRCLKYATENGLRELKFSPKSHPHLFSTARKYSGNSFSNKAKLERDKASGLVADLAISCRRNHQFNLVDWNGNYSGKVRDPEGHVFSVNPNIIYVLQDTSGQQFPFMVFFQSVPHFIPHTIQGVIESFLQGLFEHPTLEVSQFMFLTSKENRGIWRQTLSECIGNKRRYLKTNSASYDPDLVECFLNPDFEQQWRVATEKEISLGFHANIEIRAGALGDVWHDVNGFSGASPFPKLL